MAQKGENQMANSGTFGFSRVWKTDLGVVVLSEINWKSAGGRRRARAISGCPPVGLVLANFKLFGGK